MSLLDFPRVAKQEFDIKAVELYSPFFASRDRRYLTELENAALGEGVEFVHIAVENAGDLCAPDRAARQKAVEANAAWLPAAAHLGCKTIRVDAGGVGREQEADAMMWVIDGYLELAERGAKEGVIVLIENQPGITSHPDRIIQIIETVNNPWIGALLDLAAFPADVDRYEAIQVLLPYTAAVHAHTRAFNEQGLETSVDFAHCYYLMQREKFQGFVGILYDGEGSDQEGVLKTKALLEKCERGEIKFDAGVKPIAAVKTIGKKLPQTGKKISAGLKKIGFRFEI